MIEVILNRVLVEPEQLKKEHKVEGTDKTLLVAYGKEEAKHEKSRVEGIVVDIGPTAYKDLTETCPIGLGDHVVFARYSGVFVTDPETGKTLVVLNDSDILCKVIKEGESK